jgi:hypothetical protein
MGKRKSESFVILPSSQVSEMCKKTLDRITESRMRDLGGWVSDEVARSEKSIIRRVLKLRALTPEEVLDDNYINPRDVINERSLIECRYSRQFDLAEKLLNATKYSDQIHVTVEDLDHIT